VLSQYVIPETILKLHQAVRREVMFEGKPELEIAKTKACVREGCGK